MKVRIATTRRVARAAPRIRLEREPLPPADSTRAARAVAPVDLQSVAGEEDPGAALDLPRANPRT